MSFRKIAIVGTGAIGGYYGACLSRAENEVNYLVRSDFDVLKTRGLKVTTPLAEWIETHPRVFQNVMEIGACDLVIVALKATANGALERLVAPLLHKETAVLTRQNGLGSDELIAEKFGAERVIGGLCFICVYRSAPVKSFVSIQAPFRLRSSVGRERRV